MIRKGLLAFVAWYLAASMALACAGQGGKVIFEDNFTDDSGGWEADNPKFMEIKDGAMAIHPNPSGAKAYVVNARRKLRAALGRLDWQHAA